MSTRKTKRVPKWLAAIAMAVVTFVGTASAQTITYLHTDALGSPVAETDASGNVIKRYAYEPYGAVVGGEVTDGPGYTGHVSDAATGLSYMQQRYMDPQLGVFLSIDPVTAYLSGDMRHFNAYAYGFNNPYKFTDPDGRCPMACPNDMANPVTSAQATTILGWVADGLDAIDQAAMAVPQGQLEHAAVAPVVVGLRGLAAEARAATLAKNVVQGAKAEAKVAAELGAEVAGKRVTLEASTGQRSVADIVRTDKGVVEVKSGGARLSPGQNAIKADVEAGRPVTPRGANAEKAGLEVGKPTQMKCYDVKRCQ